MAFLYIRQCQYRPVFSKSLIAPFSQIQNKPLPQVGERQQVRILAPIFQLPGKLISAPSRTFFFNSIRPFS